MLQSRLDKNGVYYVFYYQENNITNYAQEIGQVGCHGKPFFIHLFYINLSDLSQAKSIHDL
jgi:hypothetical protein